jgi:hypothetical protein
VTDRMWYVLLVLFVAGLCYQIHERSWGWVVFELASVVAGCLAARQRRQRGR